MSLLPYQNIGSTSSSEIHTQNSDSNHGFVFSPQPQQEEPQLLQSPISLSHQTQILDSLQISNPQPFVHLSGPVAASEEVIELRNHNGKKHLAHQDIGRNFQCGAASGAEDAQRRGKLSGTIVSPCDQHTSGSANCHGTAIHSAGRKGQMVSGNHLLNFHYNPISRSQPRTPPPRRQPKRKAYNKDLFLQANYKFVVLDSGNYASESMDPDKMLQWEDIICVKHSTPYSVQCPICLEAPLCPQITSCGHIFCFPCILQYFFVGEEDNIGECWKKCPLCFMMISSKDLYTIYIENVNQHCVGDTIEFMLLTRQKDSFTLSLKNKQGINDIEEVHDSFSKFTLTLDVDLSVREAMSDLDSWLARANSGLVDDLEKLPYVCAAMEQLERRKKYWNEQRVSNIKACRYDDCSTGSHGSPPTENATGGNNGACQFVWGTLATSVNAKSKWLWNPTPDQVDGLDHMADVVEACEDQNGALSSSYMDIKSVQQHSDGIRKDRDSYIFYQAVDGQHFILHPLNMKCLLHHYGSYDRLPHRISGKILQLETVTQSEAIRRRYRFLSHFSLTTTFQFSEIDLSEILPTDALFPFMDEINNREKQRKRLAKKEHEEKIKDEAAAAYFMPISYNFPQSFHNDPPTFSIDDFEALGSSTVTSSSPPNVGKRQLFSNVARLGFAAGHDSPALKIKEDETLPKTDVSSGSTGVTGSSNIGTPSFANVISRARPTEAPDVSRVTEMGKKGKKSNRVLLSTAGGRRY